MTVRAAVGIVALDAVLLLVGLALLYGIGLVRSGRAALRYAGLGLFTGWAVLGVLSSWLLVAGASLELWQILLLALVPVLAGAGIGRRTSEAALAPVAREHGLPLAGCVAAVAVLVAYLADLLRAAVVEVTTAWDANAFWVLKSAAIVGQGGLHTGIGRFASFWNPDYPPLSPVEDAVTWRFVGRLDVGALPTEHWVIAVAFLAGAVGLLAGRVRPVVLWIGITLAALMPGFQGLIGSSLGDEPLAMLLGLAALAGALWVLERDSRLLILCGIFEVAAAWTKVEGLPGALLIGVMLLFAVRFRHWQRIVPLIVAPVMLILPWRIWMHVHHVVPEGAVPYGKLLHPAFLWAARGRLGTALADLPGYLLDPGNWLLAVPTALLLAVLLVPRTRALSGYVIGVVCLAFVGNAVVYGISPLPIHWYIDTSAPRVVSSSALICALLCPLLFGLATSRRGEAAGQGPEP